ncbi:hypothetical protein SAMN05444161_3558 [Rhizobiales bacterium GAS191]|nr:hypothetical protein SAMN05444161_3558 [Rhizobiales bacterium GAS191]
MAGYSFVPMPSPNGTNSEGVFVPARVFARASVRNPSGYNYDGAKGIRGAAPVRGRLLTQAGAMDQQPPLASAPNSAVPARAGMKRPADQSNGAPPPEALSNHVEPEAAFAALLKFLESKLGPEDLAVVARLTMHVAGSNCTFGGDQEPNPATPMSDPRYVGAGRDAPPPFNGRPETGGTMTGSSRDQGPVPQGAYGMTDTQGAAYARSPASMGSTMGPPRQATGSTRAMDKASLAMDARLKAAARSSFNERFPDAARIKIL